MGLAEEWMELAQNGTIICRDGRTTGAQNWITNGLHRRPLIDAGEVQTLQDLFGLAGDYPATPLTVVPYVYIQRIPLAT